MVLEKLGNAFKKAISGIASAIFLDKKKVDLIVKELQRALLEADVDVKLVFELSEKIRKQALSEKSPLEKKEQLIKLIHDELVNILGKEEYNLEIDKKKNPYKIMMLGLYGAGKTTTISKLAAYYSKRGFKCCMLGLDVHRPAAPEQLEQLGQRVNVPAFINKTEKNPSKIYNEFKDKISKYDLCFIDTAGRDALDDELIKEIKNVSREINPNEIILVMPADIGQSAKKQASEFKKACNITGVIITRLDGTAKGGGALAACAETGAKVLFIGTGEKPNDIETFNPTDFAGRLLGMGDLKALMEKAKEAIDEKSKEKLESRLKEGKFTLDDLFEQLKAMQSMGPLSKITELIPGLGKIKMPTNLIEVQEGKLKKWGYAIQSMTKEEKENPELLEKQTSRLQRIARGSGINVADVRELLKQYKMVKKFFGSMGGMAGMDASNMNQRDLQKLAKKFRGKIKF